VIWRDADLSAMGLHAPVHDDLFLERRAVDFASSSALLVRGEVWDAVGGLDERFNPAYYIDVDLGMAIRSLGRLVLYEPGARTLHQGGASGSARAREELMERNRDLFRGKWATKLAAHEEPGEGGRGVRASDGAHSSGGRAHSSGTECRHRR